MTLKGTFLLVLLYITVTLQAQQRGASITGQVADSLSGKPVEFATVVLMQAADRRAVAHTLADNQGGFSFTGVAFGAYQVGITMLGYAPRVIDTFRVDSAHLTHRLGVRYITKTTQQLEGVTVTGKKPLIELEDEKLIYNVENDIEKDNSTAADIMRKIPMITVDADGTIKLKGQTNYKVLLNGRATSIVTKDPKDVLRTYPASMIKRIEIIAEPSAKYDAEGIGGIINIITQKLTVGYNGSIFTNYNTLGTLNGGGTFSARKNKLGISAYAGGSTSSTRNSSSTSRESFIPGNRNLLLQESNNRSKNSNASFSLEVTYDIDSTNSMTIFGNTGMLKNRNHSPQNNTWYDSTGKLTQTGEYISDYYGDATGQGLGIDYQKKFKKPGHELSFVLNWLSGNNGSYADNSQRNTPGSDSFYRNDIGGYTSQTNIQLDYTLPLPKEQKLEAGIKGAWQTTDNSFDQSIRNPEGKMVPNPQRSNIFNSQQNVIAFYATYRFKISSKISSKLGARLEHTHLLGDYVSNNISFTSDYLNLIPTLNITWQLQPLSSFSFSYSRRLQRPGIYMLNPYINDNDPNNISYGNPALKPAYANSFGLYYNHILDKISLNASIDYSFSNNAIQNVTSIDSIKAITKNTYDNIGKTGSGGLNLSLRYMMTNKWNLNTNARLSYYNYSDGNSLHNSGVSASVYLSTDYNFGHDFRSDAYFSFNSGSPTLQGSSGENIGYGFTLRKELLDKKMAVSVSADQPFRKQRPAVSETKDAFFRRTFTSYIRANAYNISLSWRFGRLTRSATRKTGIDTSL